MMTHSALKDETYNIHNNNGNILQVCMISLGVVST